MASDVVLNKAASIERCLKRIQEEYWGNEQELISNFTRQDAIILNLLRACETAIDLAMHLVKEHRLGLPQSSRDAFDLLSTASIISADSSLAMKRMVGFRNIAIHQYQQLDPVILRSILDTRLGDFNDFLRPLLSNL